MKTLRSPYIVKTALAALLLLAPAVSHAQAQETPTAPTAAKETAKPATLNLTGVWRSNEAGAGRNAWKFIQDGHWSMTEQTANGSVTIHHGGTYTLEGDVYAESVLWAGDVTR